MVGIKDKQRNVEGIGGDGVVDHLRFIKLTL